MVAIQDIVEGEKVAVATPFACIEYLENMAEGCFACGKITARKVQCPQCIDVWFCSQTCIANKLHQNKCDKMFKRTDCEIVRLVSKIIFNAIDIFGDIVALFDFSRSILFRTASSSVQNPSYQEMLQLKSQADDIGIGVIARKVVAVVGRHQRISAHLNTKPADSKLLFAMACQHSATIKLNSFSETLKISK